MPDKAIVFDIDGTLVDSVDLHTRVRQEALMEVDSQIRFAELRSQIGKVLTCFFPAFSVSQRSSASAKGVEASGRDFQTTVFPQVRPLGSAPQLFS